MISAKGGGQPTKHRLSVTPNDHSMTKNERRHHYVYTQRTEC